MNLKFIFRWINRISGETGSGKSIIIDAIGQLIGMRASSDYVRHGEKPLLKVYLI